MGKGNSMKRLISMVLGITAIALTMPNGAAAQTKLLFSTFFPPAHTLVADVFKPWAAAVKAESNGRVIIEFSPSSLAPPPKQLDMVQKGIADVTGHFSGVTPRRLSTMLISQIPGTVTTSKAMSVALWRTHNKHLAKANELKGTKLLSMFVFPAQMMFGTKDQPISSIADLKKAKIATTPGTSAKAFGAVTSGVVAGPAFRYFSLVSKGMVDAYVAVTPLDVIGFNLANYTKNATDMGDLGTAGSFTLVLNQRKWNGLPAEDKKAVMRVSGENFSRRFAALDRKNKVIKAQLKKKGVAFGNLPGPFANDLRKAFAFVESDWIKTVAKRGVNGAAALQFYRETQRAVVAGK